MTLSEVQGVAELWLSGASVTPLGDGHIHDTYLLESGEKRLVLQRLNEYVFVDAELVMAQTQRLLACWSSQSDYLCPRLEPSLSGDLCIRLNSGLWRAWGFIEGRTIDPADNPAQAYAAGLAFARLQENLKALSEPHLKPTIDHFLDLSFYLQAFDAVAAQAPSDLLRTVDEHRNLVEALEHDPGHIHGDCKINNLLFDLGSDKVIAILDFDTAMYGHRALDFGDLFRSMSASLGRVDLAMFESCLRGFRAGGVALTSVAAVTAPAYVSFMLGVRFLTDHLQGDVYFKVSHPGENLARAEDQFNLLAELENKRPELQAIAAA